MSMVWYHGTSDANARAILRDGFRLEGSLGWGGGVYFGSYDLARAHGTTIIVAQINCPIYSWNGPLCMAARQESGFENPEIMNHLSVRAMTRMAGNYGQLNAAGVLASISAPQRWTTLMTALAHAGVQAVWLPYKLFGVVLNEVCVLDLSAIRILTVTKRPDWFVVDE